MQWKAWVNRVLHKAFGLTLVRAEPDGPKEESRAELRSRIRYAPTAPIRPAKHPEIDRLLRQPVFIMSTVRSGSTLLRALLNAHSEIHAPHELHIRRLHVLTSTSMAEKSMGLLELNEADLEHLLWDRVLQRELQLSGKSILVDKTPSNTWAFERIRTVWPDARFIFLLRHPASIAQSWAEVNASKWERAQALDDSVRYMKALQRARQGLSGLTVRYEELTADPEAVTQQICEFLGVPWEARMLDYGHANQQFHKGVGDWSDAIHQGRVQPGRAAPTTLEDVPPRLRPMSRRWGYLPPRARVDAAEKRADAEDVRSEAELPDDDVEADEAS
jgi:LPS sulfotransferase NodH